MSAFGPSQVVDSPKISNVLSLSAKVHYIGIYLFSSAVTVVLDACNKIIIASFNPGTEDTSEIISCFNIVVVFSL